MKVTLRRIARILVSLSFFLMIALGLFTADGPAGTRIQQKLELPGWIDHSGNPAETAFFGLAALNLLLVWLWLIRCAARGDFVRLAAGIFIGSLIVAMLLFLTPSSCSRSSRLGAGGLGDQLKRRPALAQPSIVPRSSREDSGAASLPALQPGNQGSSLKAASE